MKTRQRNAPRRIRERGPTIDEAMGALLVTSARPVEGSTALVICARIGEAAFVPRDYGTADCAECGQAVWISPDVVDASERRGMVVRPLCRTCLQSNDGGRP